MRKHIIWASATLAITIGVAGACGGPSTTSQSPGSGCANASAPHRAYVVVVHMSTAAPVQKCVGFSGETIDGQTLMDKSGIEYQTQTFSFGKAVCQVDNEPAQYAKCFADNGPNWVLFVASGGVWTLAQSAYTRVTLRDREALGWRYTVEQSPAPPPLPKE